MTFAAHVIICGLFGLFIIFLLIIGVIHNIITKIKDTIAKKLATLGDTKDSTSMDIRILIHINLCLILMNMILLLFRFLFVNMFVNKWHDKYCIFPSQISMSIFQLTRTIMYIIFVRRIQVIFVDTIFELKHKYIHVLYAMIGIYLLPYISYFNWSLLFVSTYNKVFACSISFNIYPYQPILFWFLSLMDLLISLCCLYLFVSPFYQLLKHQDDKEIKNQLYNVMIKYSILQSTAICSAFILTILSFLWSFGYYYMMIDGLINGMMLILLHPLHNICYKRLCCVLHKCCITCCNQIAIYQEKKPPLVRQDKQLRLEQISVAEQHIHISDVFVETPIDLLLVQSINTYQTTGLQTGKPTRVDDLLTRSLSSMYRKAANAQAAFEIKTKNINPCKLKSKSAQQVDGQLATNIQISISKIHETVQIAHAPSKMRTKDLMKQNAEKKCDQSLKVDNLNLDTNKHSPQYSLSQLSTIRSSTLNCLNLINYESTHL